LRHASTTEDADFTWEKYEAAYNELANDLGNLVQRLSTLAKKNEIAGQQGELKDLPEFDERMRKYEFNFAFEILWKQIMDLNKRIDEEKPWALAKTDPEKAKEVLVSLIKSLLDINKRLAIFIPDTAEQIEAIFTAEQITPPETPLFPKA
jgi:methionyl-tRNA synthetase